MTSEQVSLPDPTMADLVQDMLDTMYAAGGVGLAAVQIGVLKRVVVIDIEREGPRQPQIFINPRVLRSSAEPTPFLEGCLSLPGVMLDVWRPQKIWICYMTLDGTERAMEATGVLAVCLQHEIDHLNGTLIIDHARLVLEQI
jgi:peptide deformylase